MNLIVRSRAPVFFLLFALWTVPAAAGERPVRTDQGVIAGFWQMLTKLVPDLADLGPGLDPLGGTAASEGIADPRSPELPTQPGADSDLGPGLDPLG